MIEDTVKEGLVKTHFEDSLFGKRQEGLYDLPPPMLYIIIIYIYDATWFSIFINFLE